MGATGIEWTIGPNGEPGFTFNPWIGCTKILGPEPERSACLNCYAESASVKFGSPWGPHADRYGISESTWDAPAVWNRRALREGRRFRVFTGSMCDVLDNHRSIRPEWRQRHFETVEATPNLDWLFLTKRPENARKFLPYRWFLKGGWPPNAWFGFTAEHQEAFDRRAPHARRIPAPVRFISVEPMLGELRLPGDAHQWLHWIICGGESGKLADIRDTDLALIRQLSADAYVQGIPFFMKQLPQISHRGVYKDFAGFPEDIRVRQHPGLAVSL